MESTYRDSRQEAKGRYNQAARLIEVIKNKINEGDDGYKNDVKDLEHMKSDAESNARAPGDNTLSLGLQDIEYDLDRRMLDMIDDFLDHKLLRLIAVKNTEKMNALTKKVDALTATVDALASKIGLIHNVVSLLTNPPELLAAKNLRRAAPATVSRCVPWS